MPLPPSTQSSTVILGASRDGLEGPGELQGQAPFPFDLVSDKDETLCQAFDVIKLKKMYGKESLGVERSTFLIDADGIAAPRVAEGEGG